MLDGWTFSKHAIERACEMAVDPEELRNAVMQPELTYESFKYPGCIMQVWGRIALAVNPRRKTVITVLWDGYFDRVDDMDRVRDKEKRGS